MSHKLSEEQKKETEYQANVEKAITAFNTLFTKEANKFDFIKSVYENDGVANMEYPRQKLNELMDLIINEPTKHYARNFFINTCLTKITAYEEIEDVLSLFKKNKQILDKFCLYYLLFKQSFNFDDSERFKITKILSNIARELIEVLDLN
ncbi:DUF1951 domain-containing protein [Mycoplasmoides gallisepticum]|uniref:DUF1951 domain-containing protein n=3 Tax=Mycoplasmoides gallisepticum TaxID=2096 RepID=Q7NBW6_MYCGA|nr:DUF1951 domain-containing protein [Mycoplasmoides gallisepticum]AAP56494.2 conserved hypothetical protein [Mycoplasmoides gallisepticum str. R(low)]ADC30327.1 conserved hypothetical protein [Mycoplasmoides gallisepticum str. R(high)]AFP75779.1 hypothetical protein HFMG94VAA_1060 [Mycoplasmoides gallisepticum VA94_7994-1-7P]AFP76546.1 hypothetical protein HFMG95NCA_1060 [Mycoplasmoides gallisepticum NC95_13295-2-2P]AFP77300.1 hypothetical protein HFMG96NCA_1060 [Mycoplasmoides gallisepticum 